MRINQEARERLTDSCGPLEAAVKVERLNVVHVDWDVHARRGFDAGIIICPVIAAAHSGSFVHLSRYC